MDLDNPYLNMIEKNHDKKAADLVSVKDNLKTIKFLDLKLPVSNAAGAKRPREQKENVRSSPYQMRVRSKLETNIKDNIQPLRRISPRIAQLERRSLEESSLAEQTMAASMEEKYPRLPQGPLPLQDCVQHVDKEDWVHHVSGVGHYQPPPPLALDAAPSHSTSDPHSKRAPNKDSKGKSRWWLGGDKSKRLWVYPQKTSESLDRFKERVSKLSIWPGCVARLLSERITSLTLHPSKDMLVIAAGGKKGSLGLWIVNPALGSENCMVNLEKSESPTGIYRFLPHSGQVNCISFCAYSADRLFTSSYDGTVRYLNFDRLAFDELLSAPRDMTNNWMQWHCQLSPNVLLVSQGTGNVYVVDDRTNTPYESILRCYNRSCRTVDIHPLHPMYIATSSSLGYVSIWDLRKFGRRNATTMASGSNDSDSIVNISIHGTVSSAFFSPVTGNGLLVTSSDEHIRIYDASKLVDGINSPTVFRVETKIRHHHKSFQWLTPFRATWHPQRDDAFIVGSLNNPRRVECFGRHGRLLCNLGMSGGTVQMNTVCPVNVFHPNRLLLASADSGGKVSIFL